MTKISRHKNGFFPSLTGIIKKFKHPKPLAQQEFFAKAKFIQLIDPEDCLSAPGDVIRLNMYTVQVTDLEEMRGEFQFCSEKPGVFHGFTAWFTVQFEGLETGGATVELNTGPNSDPTHWKQTLFMLEEPIHVHSGDSIRGNIILLRNPVWRRHMTVTLHWSINGSTDNGQANISLFIIVFKFHCSFFPFSSSLGWDQKFSHVEVTVAHWLCESKVNRYNPFTLRSCCPEHNLAEHESSLMRLISTRAADKSLTT